MFFTKPKHLDVSAVLDALDSLRERGSYFEQVRLLREIAPLCLPAGSQLRHDIEGLPDKDAWATDDEKKNVISLVDAAIVMLPLYHPPTAETTETTSGTPRPSPSVIDSSTSNDINHEIQAQVRLFVTQEFTSSLLFRGMALALAVALTLFCFGLFSLDSRVKSAGEVVQKMDQQLATSQAAMNTAVQNAESAFRSKGDEVERSLGAMMKDAAKAQTDAMASVYTQLNTRMVEVQEAQSSAVTEINKVRANDVDELNNERDRQLKNIAAHAREITQHLEQPTWKDRLVIGIETNWPVYCLVVLSLFLSLRALGKRHW